MLFVQWNTILFADVMGLHTAMHVWQRQAELPPGLQGNARIRNNGTFPIYTYYLYIELLLPFLVFVNINHKRLRKWQQNRILQQTRK